MNRSLLLLALYLFAAPGYSMTATVTSATAPATAPTAPVTSAPANSTAAKSAATSAAPDPRSVAAAPSKPMPNAASITRPSAVLSAPGVPMKSNAVTGARPGAAPSKASVMMPSASSQAGSAPPEPSNAAWSATADGSAGMHWGTLEAVNVGAGTFQVFGQKLTFNAQRVKVFNRDGKPGSIFALKSGASIRFTLDAADTQHRRVAVIYVN